MWLVLGQTTGLKNTVLLYQYSFISFIRNTYTVVAFRALTVVYNNTTIQIFWLPSIVILPLKSPAFAKAT